MPFEFILLGALIFVFFISFCGLLQKIKQTFDRERILAERIARRRELQRTQLADALHESYCNPNFTTEGGIFPAAPPPYTQYYIEPPPKYDDVVKVHQTNSTEATQTEVTPENSSSQTGPPPYTITINDAGR